MVFTVALVVLLTMLDSAQAQGTSPGDVIASGPATFIMGPLHRSPVPDVTVTKVWYRSTDAHGDDDTVSGTILVPAAPYPGQRPLVGYAVGTHGLGDRCAPSAMMAAGVEPEAAMIAGLLARGWAVAVTDYEGLGTPGRHTYLVGPSMGHAVLDILRAATRLPGGDLTSDTPMVIWGYSQGGAAAGWAAQLQPSYAPELRLAGVAAGGVPADVAAIVRHLDGGAAYGLAVAALAGMDAADPQLRLDRYLTETGRSLVRQTQDACLGGLIPPFALKNVRSIATVNVLDLPNWQDRFAQSRLGAVAPQVPILLYHGLLDDVVPYSLGADLRDQYCARGVVVRWLPYPAAEHTFAAVDAAPTVMTWLTDRFAGRPPADTCPHPVTRPGSRRPAP